MCSLMAAKTKEHLNSGSKNSDYERLAPALHSLRFLTDLQIFFASY